MSRLPFGLRIGSYYFITYLLTGIFFLLQGATGISGLYFQFPQLRPALAAVIFIALEGNSIKSFLKRGFRFAPDRYSLAMIFVSILLALTVSTLTTKLWGIDNFNNSYMNMDGAFLAVSTVIAAACEEIGWRGYLLPRLQSRMPPVKSSIILSLLWGLWHVPNLLMGYKFFAAWFIGIMGLTFVLTYSFNRSKGNIWSVTLIHSSVNLMAAFFLLGFVTDIRVTLLNSFAYILWAAAVVILERRHINKKAGASVSSES